MSLKPEDKKRILEFYEDSFAKYGNNPRSVHWSGEISQNARFDVLVKIAPLDHKCVLDAGCGLGDFYKYFLAEKINVDYTGIDIVPAFIDRARERFPEACFVLSDIASLDKQYDYILASGALTVATENIGKDYYFTMIKTMFNHCKYGIAFNMLNKATYSTDETYLSYDIDEVVRFCKNLTDNVVVIDNYLPQDFTVYVYKQI